MSDGLELDPVIARDHDLRVSTPPVDATQHVPDDATLPAPREPLRFGRYRVIALLGSGASGAVYRAHDSERGIAVAVKALHPRCDAAVRARFLNEAHAIGSVTHPHILRVLDTGTDGDTPYFTMELAVYSLRDAMRASRLDVDAARRLGIEIAGALAAAHAAGIVHRDVKPANILACADGAWKLADFGIARLPDSTLTDTGQFLGSPSYAAPESLRAAQFTPASDLYALAATLYEVLAGVPPHGDHDIPSVVRKLEHDPPPLQLRCPVPRAIADAIMAALARDPAARPSAQQLAQLLADETAPVPVVPDRNHRIQRVAIAAAVLAACLLAIAIVVRMRDASPPKPSVFASPRVDRAPTVPRKPAPAPAPAPAAPAPPAQPTPAMPVAPPSAFPNEPDELLDDETAREMLELLERDARRELDGVRVR